MSEAERLHRHLIGQQGSRRSLNTPALVLDLEMLDRNIAEMASFAKAHNVKLRPHSKTHKSADIARRQIASGALGVCCAKLGEAEALGEAGIEGLHITSPVVTPQAITRLIALNGKMKDLMVVVDHPANVDALAAAPRKAGKPLTVIVDIDPGMHRTGVATPDGRGRAGAEDREAEVAEICRRAVLLRPPPAHRGLRRAQGRDRGAHGVSQGHPRQARGGRAEARHRHRLGHRHAFHRRQARRLHRAAGRLLRVHGPRIQCLRPARPRQADLRAGAADRRPRGERQHAGHGHGRCRPEGDGDRSRARR